MRNTNRGLQSIVTSPARRQSHLMGPPLLIDAVLLDNAALRANHPGFLDIERSMWFTGHVIARLLPVLWDTYNIRHARFVGAATAIRHSGGVSPRIPASPHFPTPETEASGRDGSEPTRRSEPECPALAAEKLHYGLHQRSPSGRRMKYRP